MGISVNTVVINITNGIYYLILWISPDRNFGYWHNLSSTTRVPTKFNVEDILAKIAQGKFETDALQITFRPEEKLSIKERECRDRRWELIKELVGREPEIYEKDQRLGLLREAIENKQTTISNLYKLWTFIGALERSKMGCCRCIQTVVQKTDMKKQSLTKGLCLRFT